MKKMILALVLISAASVFAGERFFEEEYPVEPNARFSLDSHKGHIQIRTDNGSTIRVKARTHDGDEELLEHVEIIARSSDDYVEIRVKFNDDAARSMWDGLLGKSHEWPLTDFEIVVPDTASLRLDSHKSTFDLEAPSGRIDIESHKGTGTIKGVRSDFKLESHKGQFDVEILQLADLRVETHKGDLSFLIHDAHDFSISGETHKGDIRFRGRDVPIRAKKHGTSISHRVGSGEHRIELSTHKGQIQVEFAN